MSEKLEKKVVFVLKVAEGKGTEDDIVRIVTYYLDLDGNVIFHLDPEEVLKKEENKDE